MRRNILSWPLVLLALCLASGCTPRPLPGEAAGLALQPGNYLSRFFRAADFSPQMQLFRIEAFSLGEVVGLDPELAGQLFQEELQAALTDNGLRVAGDQAGCAVTGAIDHLSLRSPFIRFFTGKSHADLLVSGAISQGENVVFAFQDRVAFTVLVSPRQPPLEPPLLARRAFRQFAHNLLNELLLTSASQPSSSSLQEIPAPSDQGLTADGG